MTDPLDIKLNDKADCLCGASVTVTAAQVLRTEFIVCPECKEDLYIEEWLYEEALNIAEDVS